MLKSIKNKLFFVVSTFLAFVLSIVSFGSYHKVAKADGIEYPPDVGSLDFSVEAFVDALFPNLWEIAPTNGPVCIFLDNQFMQSSFQAGDDLADVRVHSSEFMSYFISKLFVRYNISNNSYPSLKAELRRRNIHLVTYVSGNQYTNLVTGDSYDNVDADNTSSFYNAIGLNVATTTFFGILNMRFNSQHMYNLLVNIQSDKGGTSDDMPVYVLTDLDDDGFIVHNSFINEDRLEICMYDGYGFMDALL